MNGRREKTHVCPCPSGGNAFDLIRDTTVRHECDDQTDSTTPGSSLEELFLRHGRSAMIDNTGAVYDLGYEPYEGDRRGRVRCTAHA